MKSNTDWNTPPNGDFARYVEQLSAQAARRVVQQNIDAIEPGMAPAAGSPGTVPTLAQRRASAKDPGAKGGVNPAALKVVGAVGALVFLVLWSIGVPLLALVGGLGAVFWIGRSLVKVIASPGVAKWQRELEEANRNRRQQQQQQQGSN